MTEPGGAAWNRRPVAGASGTCMGGDTRHVQEARPEALGREHGEAANGSVKGSEC